MFGGKPRAGLASMSLGELKDGVLAEEQLLEGLCDKNKEEEKAEEVKATLVECRVTLGKPSREKSAVFFNIVQTGGRGSNPLKNYVVKFA